jgi:hypothetical protein
MKALHTLGILSASFMRNAFPTIPNHLNWFEVGGLWRPGHLMRPHITLLIDQMALTQPEKSEKKSEKIFSSGLLNRVGLP